MLEFVKNQEFKNSAKVVILKNTKQLFSKKLTSLLLIIFILVPGEDTLGKSKVGGFHQRVGMQHFQMFFDG